MNIDKIKVTISRLSLKNKSDIICKLKVENKSASILEEDFYKSASCLIYKILK